MYCQRHGSPRPGKVILPTKDGMRCTVSGKAVLGQARPFYLPRTADGLCLVWAEVRESHPIQQAQNDACCPTVRHDRPSYLPRTEGGPSVVWA